MFFEEDVPFIVDAEKLVQECDAMIVVGTSLNVYPAAGILHHVKPSAQKWLIDPGEFNLDYVINLKHIKKVATEGVGAFVNELK